MRAVNDALRDMNETLETRVAERTAELRHVVDALHAEARERQRAEAALRQSQKLEAIGQLTGGIAHDFNNMLQMIGGNLDLLRQCIPLATKCHVDNAWQGVARAAALTQRLLAFARRQTLQPREVKPNELIEDMEDLMRATLGPAFAIECQTYGPVGAVNCDPNQLENALLNLVINARDAMSDNGRIVIGTNEVCLEEADIADQTGANPGRYVEFFVTDSGIGMDEATRGRAFEPFFTTKPIGQGTGLGLSQVYGFVQQSGGFVCLDSERGQGTTVRLYLPRQEPTGGQKEMLPSVTEPKETDADEALLVVEDEVGVREAEDGSAALRILAQARVDMLVTDVGLPGGLNGRQVAEAAREVRTALPVLFITGYAGSVLTSQLAPGMEVLGKPFAMDVLAAKVRTMLECPAC